MAHSSTSVGKMFQNDSHRALSRSITFACAISTTASIANLTSTTETAIDVNTVSHSWIITVIKTKLTFINIYTMTNSSLKMQVTSDTLHTCTIISIFIVTFCTAANVAAKCVGTSLLTRVYSHRTLINICRAKYL